MEYFLEDLLRRPDARGSIYALIALGYTMVYGIIQLINFAHGEIYMIGAFTALIVSGVLAAMGLARLVDHHPGLADCGHLFVGIRLHHRENRL